MMELRLVASDPAFARMDELTWMICCAVNPHMVLARDMDMPDIEMRALIDCLMEEAAHWIELGAPFLNFALQHRCIGEPK